MRRSGEIKIMAIIKWSAFVPVMDVYKEKDSLVIKTPIADFDPKNIDIEIKDNVLTVSGKTEKKSEVEEKNYYRKEIKSGSFFRSISLPAKVQEKKIKSEYKDGVLKITLPLIREAKAKEAKITARKSKEKKKKK